MNKAEFIELLNTMAEGWNSGDVEKVAACFAEKVSYGDPTRYAFTSRQELKPFFEPPDGGSQQCTWHRVIFDEEAQTGAAEYTYTGHQTYHGCVVARVEGGVVFDWREWQHTSDLDWEEFVAGRA